MVCSVPFALAYSGCGLQCWAVMSAGRYWKPSVACDVRAHVLEVFCEAGVEMEEFVEFGCATSVAPMGLTSDRDATSSPVSMKS